MPNWCSNSVVFTADEQTLENIHALFEEMEQKQRHREQYYLPDFIKQEGGYMQDIVFDSNRIAFETRWTPNTETLMEIADFTRLILYANTKSFPWASMAKPAMTGTP